MSEQNAKTTELNGRSLFSFFYRTRIKVTKGSTTILNLSLLFSIISLLCAPWLVIIGAVVALVLGYRFAIERNAQAFSANVKDIVKDAAGNVKSAVDAFDGSQSTESGNESGDQSV